MTITVNGKQEEIESMTILDFLHHKGVAPEAVIVEHNYRIVKRDRWNNIQLQENDNLEVINMIGGG